AALRVKVTASTRLGSSVPTAARCAMRCVSTRVLPEPAPARMRRGEASEVTASSCAGLRLRVRCPVAAVGCTGWKVPAGSDSEPPTGTVPAVLDLDEDE